MSQTRYDHKVGCKCPLCRGIDSKMWYSEDGDWMITLNAKLRQRPEGCMTVTYEDDTNYWDEGYFES